MNESIFDWRIEEMIIWCTQKVVFLYFLWKITVPVLISKQWFPRRIQAFFGKFYPRDQNLKFSLQGTFLQKEMTIPNTDENQKLLTVMISSGASFTIW